MKRKDREFIEEQLKDIPSDSGLRKYRAAWFRDALFKCPKHHSIKYAWEHCYLPSSSLWPTADCLECQKAKYEQMVADREQRGNKARHHDGQRHAGKEKAECEGHDCKAAGHDCKAAGHDCDKAKAGHECDKAKAQCDKAKAQCDKAKAECSKGHECKDKVAGHDCKDKAQCDKAKAGHNCDKAKAQCDKAKAECGKGHDCKDKAQCDGNACKKTN